MRTNSPTSLLDFVRRRGKFPFRKRSLPFETVDAISQNGRCHLISRNGYLYNEGRQSLSCAARSFSDMPAMKRSSAAKLRRQNPFSQFRRTTKDWSHSCISPLTEMAPTHVYINYWDTCGSPVIKCLCFFVVFFFFSSATKRKNCAIVPSGHWALNTMRTNCDPMRVKVFTC